MQQKIINLFFFDSFARKISFPLLVLFELFLNAFVVLKIKYTEIDWVAYVQEVEGFINGTLDYDKLQGQTGPLVYPAGFLYIYSILYYLTNKGLNILHGQFIFIVLYIITIILVFRMYNKFKTIPNYVLVLICCTSYRIHSIYVLRLFNDPIAMIFLYSAINCFISGHYSYGSILFSFGISVKMNIILFGPALLFIYLYNCGFWKTIEHLSEILLVQLLVGLPFLIHNSSAYFNRAFEFKRQFFYKWTVNWRLLPEHIFLDQRFQMILLALHLLCLVVLIIRYIRYAECKNKNEENSIHASSNDVILLFMSNFIGMCFSRSLHYQFYVWYYHSIPILLWHMKNTSEITRLLIWGLIEFCWNTYPSTIYSSAILHLCHAFMIYKLLLRNNGLFEKRKHVYVEVNDTKKAK